MYDISFILPLSSNIVKNKNKITNYNDRIEFFKKYGLMNVRNNKVKIFALIGNEDIVDIKKGWEFPCDIEVSRCDCSNATKKINKFYSSLNKDTISESRWFMQVDDDSITNVGDLVNTIDKDYNHIEKHNISNHNPACCLECYESEYFYRVFLEAINKTSYKGMIDDNSRHKYFYHGYECTIFSQGALHHFILNSANKEILESDIIFNAKFNGDILISICANLCGIDFNKVDYLHYNPFFDEFINKKIFHIHFIYKEEKLLFFSKMAKKILEK